MVKDLPVSQRTSKIWPHVERFVDITRNSQRAKFQYQHRTLWSERWLLTPFFEAKVKVLPKWIGIWDPFLRFWCHFSKITWFESFLIFCFMKTEVLENIKTPVKMFKIYVLDKVLHLLLKEVDLGFATKQALEKAKLLSKVAWKTAAESTVLKRMYSLPVHNIKEIAGQMPFELCSSNMACLDPVTMISKKKACYLFVWETLTAAS